MIHPTAIVSPDAQIGKNVEIGPYAVIEDNVKIGDNCYIDAHVKICRYTSIPPVCRFSHFRSASLYFSLPIFPRNVAE